jgi:hypothetical protein
VPVAQWTYSMAPPLEVKLQVEVFDVEGEDLLRPGGGLVEHPPQDSLAQAVPVIGEQLLEPGTRDGPVTMACASGIPVARVGQGAQYLRGRIEVEVVWPGQQPG